MDMVAFLLVLGIVVACGLSGVATPAGHQVDYERDPYDYWLYWRLPPRHM